MRVVPIYKWSLIYEFSPSNSFVALFMSFELGDDTTFTISEYVIHFAPYVRIFGIVYGGTNSDNSIVTRPI